MAERQVSVEFVFDRSADRELAQAYRMLVPERRARTVQRRDGDDHSQALTADLEGTSRLGPVADTGEAEHRSALGA
jgi:hypothetical protein